MNSGNLISYLVVRSAQPIKYSLFSLLKHLKEHHESLRSPFTSLSNVNLHVNLPVFEPGGSAVIGGSLSIEIVLEQL